MSDDDTPLVSIITPTFPGREKVLLERCLPSVEAQNWSGLIEHVIVSDENPGLRSRFADENGTPERRIRFIEINSTWKRPERGLAANGALPWYLGSLLGLGEFMSFLGDDDELLPHHVSAHVRGMQTAQAMWSLSKVEFRAKNQFWNVIGDQSYMEGHLDATGIMCWKGALTVANWDPNADTAAVDWKLVNDWRSRGLPGAFIDSVTGIHHDGWLTNSTGKPYE
jgi:hypothetical protein